MRCSVMFFKRIKGMYCLIVVGCTRLVINVCKPKSLKTKIKESSNSVSTCMHYAVAKETCVFYITIHCVF